ncbi:MAG: glycosyltransferase [Acidimicrobiales bacterium]|jgi:glycosyltransferase involved in cell wall biosynthesis
MTRPGRPARIDQVVHILAANDAIGTHVRHVRDALRGVGFASDIYAGEAHPEVRDLARPLDDLPLNPRPDTWLLFHHSTGSAVAEAVLRRPEPTLIDYHNITPPSYVRRWAPWMREELELGLEQLRALAPVSFFGIAHSAFSQAELTTAGCARSAVVAPLVDLATFDRAADEDVLAKRGRRRAAGGADWLFVGRVSPHKAQHDLVKALACYRRFFDPDARLLLVGSSLGTDYHRALERFVARLGLTEAVEMAGTVSDATLSAYYRSADVFVCASDHEGFCVPLVEAMHVGLPVVAFDAAAVGETVGDGGLVLADKAPMTLATAVHRVLSDGDARRSIIEAGTRRARSFSLPAGRASLGRAIDDAVTAAAEMGIGS